MELGIHHYSCHRVDNKNGDIHLSRNMIQWGSFVYMYIDVFIVTFLTLNNQHKYASQM